MTKHRTLEFTIRSAEDLRLNGNPVSKNVFVVLRAESLTSHTTSFSADNSNSGSNGSASWNEKFVVEVAAHARSVTFEVKCKTEMGVVRDIGVARIGISDLMETAEPDKSLSYRLRDWDGLRNGIITFSVRDVTAAPTTEEVEVEGNDGSSSSNEAVTGVPVE